MPDPVAITDKTPAQVAAEYEADLALAKQLFALVQKKDWIGLGKFILENKGKVEEQVEEVEAAIPLIKSGYKTTEFWLIVGFFGVMVALVVLKMPLPLSDVLTLGTLIAGYTASRHVTKN